jgi:hypothetical protein
MAMVHKPGDAPGAGVYACGRCGWPVRIVDDSVLPPCKVCGPKSDTRYFHEPVAREGSEPPEPSADHSEAP